MPRADHDPDLATLAARPASFAKNVYGAGKALTEKRARRGSHCEQHGSGETGNPRRGQRNGGGSAEDILDGKSPESLAGRAEHLDTVLVAAFETAPGYNPEGVRGRSEHQGGNNNHQREDLTMIHALLLVCTFW